MERHKQTLPMVHTSYIKIFALFLGLAVSSLGHAKNTTVFSTFFHKNIQLLKTNLLKTQLSEMPEICDNGIDDDGDGLIDCFDPDCSESCITGNLSRSFTSSSTNYGFFSYDPDPNCASTDWEDDWSKFKSPDWFYMEEYDDGSFIMRGTIVSLTDSNDSWEVWIRLHNKRSWTEWSALGRSFYEASAGGNCSANHTTWDFYETDETASRWYGTPGSANDGKVVTISHGPTDFSKGVQVGFGANNCETCSCSSFNVRGWYKMSGDLELPCGDYGSVMSGFETMNECNVYNGDFEDGLNFWEARDGVSITNDAAQGNTAGVINADNGTLAQILLPATPDYSYVATIWSKIADAPSDAVLLMEFYDAYLNPLERYATEVTNTSYQEYTFGGVAPKNTAYVSVWGWKGNGGDFYLDEFCLEIGKSYSESNCQDIQNSGFEDGNVTNWNNWGTVTATSAAYAGDFAALIYGGDGGLDQTFNITPGETYNFETYIRETNIDGNTSYGITWLDASGIGIYSFWQAYFTANYEKYQLLGRAPANAVEARIWVTKTGNGELYIDDNCFKIFERKPPIEICNNGIDDDGDGFIDGGDTDCASDCNESLLFVARANAQILQVNLSTGATSIAGTSPYTNENLNAMAANPDAGIVYYGHDKTVYHWNPTTGNHGVLIDLTNQVGLDETLTSGGGAYFNNQLYLGFENDLNLDFPTIYRITLADDGLSTTGTATNLNVPIPNNTSWGDMIVSAESGNTVIYAGLGYNTINSILNESLYFKYEIESGTYTTIRTDMPGALQIGVDVDGNLWGGALESGVIQQLDKNTGNFFGPTINIGGDMWDLTGPINCPQKVEICDNGKDDDGDGRIDSDDDDCDCPTIATTDDENQRICADTDVTFTVVTDASNLPFDEIEFYSFTAAQTNPYSALGDDKKLIGKFDNTTGMGSITSSDFEAINGMNSIYYVYAVLSPTPSDLSDCLPFLEYIITAEPCQEICDNGIDDDGDGLIDCQDPDCDNPNDGGTIAGNESNCGLYTPTLIVEQIAPSGLGASIPEYQWEKSLDNSTWMEIDAATQSTYLPTLITQTSFFRRKFKRNSCNPWITSNVVIKTVTPSSLDAEIINAPNGLNSFLCNLESYTFQAAPVDDAIYNWDFGAYANPSSAVGIGPHNVVFNTPTPNLPISAEIVLKVIGTSGALCVATDTLPINLRPLSNVITVDHEDPSVCGASDGWITLTTSGEIGGCIEVSLDGGISYQPEGQVAFTNLSADSYEIVTRYCDNSCPNIAQIVNLSDPATINLLNDDFDNVCPGFNYTSNVFINDDIKGDIVLSLASNGNFGTVVLEDNGDFIYMPQTSTCDMDQFAYTVCDPGMNCCATAVVTIDFNDDEAPVLINVPDDLTINCDEEIPLPPLVTASDNCPAISIDKEEVSTQGEEGCSLYDYSVTYTWIAQDFCGNEAIDSQQIFIKDQTAPDIYRIYTLPNGKKLVAGVMENVTHRWKVVQLPIEFNTRPLVFSQLTTSNEASPAIVRLRNISANQFEVKLQEEGANDNQRTGESVAWFAIEAGTQLADYQIDAGLFSVGDAVRNITFQNDFAQAPAFFTSMQSILDNDPASPRSENLSNTGVSVNIQEEKSVDTDITHTQEKLAYLAIDTSILRDHEGETLGETGKLMVNDTWQTIALSNNYTNPVVIANILSINEADPAIAQVNNVTANSFDIRIKEWDYLDGNHGLEAVSFIVVEGSVPLSSEKFCDFGTDSLVLGVDIVAVDNCDQNVTISYEEVESFSGPRQIFSRIWSAVDECGNETLYTKDVICEGVYVRIKAMLQGATIYNDDGLMRDDLRRKGLIPLVEPYTTNPNFKHIGGGGDESLDDSMIDITGPDACVDWVFIELCDGNDITNVVATQSAIIQRDGDVMTVKGDTLIRFRNVPPGDYFVALSHRNHLKTVSLYPYTFTPNAVPTVNFMNNFTPVIGIEPNIDLGQGTKALWSGDLNGDARVIYQGPQNDVFDMFLHVILDSINGQFLTNFISSGYTNNDFNMDGTVIFQGPNNDKSTMLFNTILKHPNNPANFSNFVIATHAQAQILNGNNPDGTIPGFDFDMDGIQDVVDPDDDNDGVADGNDIDPKNKNSDSDGDGISDDIETGKDGHYDYLVDSDPLNPCSPSVSNLCVGIDIDEDGFFRNYPITHPQYDAHDENACVPDFNNSSCSCANDIIENGNEVLIKICHNQGNGNLKTIEIPISALPTYLGNGDVCGPCNE